MRRYLSLLPLLMIVVAVTFSTSLPARAAAPEFCGDWASSPGVTWTRCYDFSQGQHGWTINNDIDGRPWGEYVSQGFRSKNGMSASAVRNERVNIRADWAAGTYTIAKVRVVFKWTASAYNGSTDGTLSITSVGGKNKATIEGLVAADPPNGIAEWSGVYVVTGAMNASLICGQVAPGSYTAGGGNCTIVGIYLAGSGTPPGDDPVYITPPREFRRPLEVGDVNTVYDWTDSNGIPDPMGTHCSRVDDAFNVITGYTNCTEINRIALEAVANSVIQTSATAYAPVHAVLGGTVLEVRQLLEYECYDIGLWISNFPYNPNGCLLEIPNWATPSTKNMFIESTSTPIYVVRIKHDDDSEMRYLIANPRVTAGLNIRDSCVLGQTIPMRTYSSLSSIFSMFLETYQDALPDAGFSAVRDLFADIVDTSASFSGGALVMGYLDDAEEAPEDIAPPPGYGQIVLDGYSSAANACDTTANFADCVSINPQFFNEGEYWLNENPLKPALWSNPGVILEPGGKITLPSLPLDPDTAYGASAQIERLVGNVTTSSRIKVTVGQSSYTESVSGTITTVRLESQTHTATVGVLYDISIENVGEDDLKVHYFCLTEGESEIARTCLFDNYSFDMGLTGWDTSGGAVNPAVPGSILLENGETISQTIPLFPNGDGSPHTYDIEIEAKIPLSTGGQIYFSWDGIAASSPVTVVPLIGFNDTATHTRQITVSTYDSQPFVVTTYLPNLSGPPVEGTITIYRVCVLGPYPQQGGGGVIDQPEGCGEIAFPSGGDVQEVLQWHWFQIDKFNRCVFIPKLNEVYKSLVKGFADLNNQFKFWRQVVYSFSAWMDRSFFPWLAGYLSNITPGTIIVEGGGSCNDLFCFLTSLIEQVVGPIVDLIVGLISQAADLLFSVIGGLLSLLITLLTQVFTLLQTVLQILFGLIQQFADAPPKPLPGMPNCGVTPTEGICVVWWVADNTLLSGPGAAIIPLIVSLLWIEIALWLIAEVKGVIVRAGTSL